MQRGLPRERWPAGVHAPPLLAALAALAAALVLGVSVGPVELGVGEVLGALWRGVSGRLSGGTDTIVWAIRLPRVLLAAMVGAALSLCGVAYQGVFRNPLADPYLLGVASGASFGAALAIVFAGALPLLGRLGVPMAAFVCACGAVATVVAAARRGTRLPVLSLVLAGAVLGSSLGAATSLVMLVAREQAATVIAWLLGSFSLASWGSVATFAPFLLAALVALLLSGRALNLLQLGDEDAGSLGLPVERVRLTLLLVATLATAGAVSVSGVIGFVGLLVPHAMRLLVGPDHRALTPLAAVAGGAFLVLADVLARTVVAPAEIPIGIVTALAGGPLFLWLLRRQGGWL